MGGMREIGLQLQKQREEKGLTLADIEKSTKISARLLKKIEAGEFDALPSGVFAKNFLRQYCVAIGVPPEPILERVFAKETESSDQSVNQPEEKPRRGKFWLLIAAFLAVGGFLAYQQGLLKSPMEASRTHPRITAPVSSPIGETPVAPAAEKKLPETKVQPKTGANGSGFHESRKPLLQSAAEKSKKTRAIGEATDQTAASVPGNGEMIASPVLDGKKTGVLSIRFEADEKCWIHLRSSEKEMDFILMKGEFYSTTCFEPAVISVGNAEHLRVFVNDKMVIFPAGQRVVKDFELKGDRKSTRLNSSHTDISRMPSSA